MNNKQEIILDKLSKTPLGLTLEMIIEDEPKKFGWLGSISDLVESGVVSLQNGIYRLTR